MNSAPFPYLENFTSYGLGFPRSYREHYASVVGKLDDIADLAKLGGKVDDIADALKAGIKADDIADVLKAGGTLDDALDLLRTGGNLDDAVDILKGSKKIDIGGAKKLTQLDDVEVKKVKLNENLDELDNLKAQMLKNSDELANLKQLNNLDIDQLSRQSELISNNRMIADKINDLQSSTKNLVKELPSSEINKLKGMSNELSKIVDNMDGSAVLGWIRRHKIATAAATALTVVVTIAIINNERISNTSYTITAIKPISNDVCQIEYTPNDMFSKNDSIVISGSDSDPNIDKTYPIVNLQNGIVQIKETIVKAGTRGTFRVNTSFQNQFNKTLDDTLEVPKSILKGGAEAVGDFLDEVIPSIPIIGDIYKMLKNFWWVILIVILISLLPIGFALIQSIRSKINS